jgi:hypothetical protein
MASETAVHSAPRWQRWIAQRELDARAFGRWCAATLAREWRGERVWSAGFVTALLACTLVPAFHLNRPNPIMPYHDAYEYVSNRKRDSVYGAP